MWCLWIQNNQCIPKPLPRTSVKTAPFPSAPVLVAQGPKAEQVLGAPPASVTSPLIHKAVWPVVKPLMEQIFAILEDVSYSMWYKFTEVCGSLACDEPEVQSLSALKIKVPMPKWRQICVSIKPWVVPRPLSSCRACSILWDRRWKEGNVPSPAVGSGHYRRNKRRQVQREAICQTMTIFICSHQLYDSKWSLGAKAAG